MSIFKFNRKRIHPALFFSKEKNSAGFTLVELLVVIGLGAILVGASAVIYSNWQVSAQLNESTAELTQNLRTARQRSVAGFNNSSHGIFLDIDPVGQDSYVLYQGSSYATRDGDYDRLIKFSQSMDITVADFILIGNDVDINFSQGLGQVINTGIITLTHSVEGSREVAVNELGVIE
ncbi:prepilin-type N-terminal cleavage/methylation domain-containing protein [Patescibacteria group bacterium]|nr:prepilin-type N-terminal cleavage/methylation domain-containing protein [Patescibacteria group bacterium]